MWFATWLAFGAALFGCGSAAPGPRVQASPGPDLAVPASPAWREDFSGALDWGSPSRHDARELSRVYSVVEDAGARFLRARHDASVPDAAPAMHYGRGFDGDPPRLSHTPILRFRWRVRQHPAAAEDPWLDLGASVYVVMKQPSLLSGGRGFKLGWVQKPAPLGTKQRGLLQVPLRSDPASDTWKSERIDLCALYRRSYGSCDDQPIVYVGVVTDADGTKSTAEADYADFELGTR